MGAQAYYQDVLTTIGGIELDKEGNTDATDEDKYAAGQELLNDVGRRPRRRDQPEVRHRVRHAHAGRHRPVLRARADRQGRAAARADPDYAACLPDHLVCLD